MTNTFWKSVRLTWSSIIVGSPTDIDLTFRQHTLFFCMALIVDGLICILLQVTDNTLQTVHLPRPFAGSLHYHNGYWNGTFTCAIASFAIISAILYPSMRPVIVPLTEIIPTSLIEKIFRKKFRSFSVLHAVFIGCFLLLASGITSMVLSINVYPYFSKYFNATLVNQTPVTFIVAKNITRNNYLHRVRTACLTIQAVLIFFNTLGILLTVLCASVTLNRIIHYAPLKEPKPKRHPRKRSTAVHETATFVRDKIRKVSSVLAPTSTAASTDRRKKYKIPHGRSNDSFQEDLELRETGAAATSSRESVGSSDLESRQISNELLQQSVEGSESRTQALIMLAEFLRNRRISRYQAPVDVLKLNQDTHNL